ncbi:Polyribonucleotide nucleotidyltransferase [Bienertia sinuspersici]
MPERNKKAIQTVKVKKIPSSLKSAFIAAIVSELVSIAFEYGKEAIVYIYEKIEGPLGDFFNNAPHTVVEVGCDAVELAEEAFAEAIKSGEHVVRAVVEGTEAVVYIVEKGTETAVNDVGNAVVHELRSLKIQLKGRLIISNILSLGKLKMLFILLRLWLMILEAFSPDSFNFIITLIKDICNNEQTKVAIYL